MQINVSCKSDVKDFHEISVMFLDLNDVMILADQLSPCNSSDEGDSEIDSINDDLSSNMSNTSGSKRQKRGILPKQATSVMRAWLFQHLVVSLLFCSGFMATTVKSIFNSCFLLLFHIFVNFDSNVSILIQPKMRKELSLLKQI